MFLVCECVRDYYLPNALAALDRLKSVYVSVSEWVCHTKRVERSTDRSLPPIFAKLATKVESQELWLPIVFWWKSEILLSSKPEVELILIIDPMENIFNVKYPENGERYDVGLKGGQIGNCPWAFDEDDDFDLGWPWTLLVQGHWNYTSNISKTVTDTTMGSVEVE